MATTIHPTAIVDDGATLGDDCRVWHWVHISAGARIGAGCSFGQNVYVGNDVAIGNNVKIGAGSVVLMDLPEGITAVGVPAKIVQRK